ncbi:MAG: hypothetical protein HYZ53_29245 [Planctomycetes bacterium]|nr:hypothetical protein [Planctomycetota bacterium]
MPPTPADFQFAEAVLHNHLAPKEDLDHALGILEETRRLGLHLNLKEVLVDLGTLTRETAAAVANLPAPAGGGPRFETGVRPLDPARDDERRIGSLAVHNLLVTPDELLDALRVQQEEAAAGPRRLLGEILVSRGALDALALESLVEFQRALLVRDRAGVRVPGTILTPEDLLFGSLVISNGLATPHQVQECLHLQREIQAQTGLEQRLGEVLFEKGYITRRAIELLLEVQHLKRKSAGLTLSLNLPEVTQEQEDRLGAVLEAGKFVRKEDVGEALSLQKKLRELGIERKLGEVLILRGFLDASKLEAALNLQERRRASLEEEPEAASSDVQSTLALLLGIALAVAGLVVAGFLLIRQSPSTSSGSAGRGEAGTGAGEGGARDTGDGATERPGPGPGAGRRAGGGAPPGDAGTPAAAPARSPVEDARVLAELERPLRAWRFEEARATCDALLALPLSPPLRDRVRQARERVHRFAALFSRLLQELPRGRFPETALRDAFHADAGVQVRAADPERVSLDRARAGAPAEVPWLQLLPSELVHLLEALELSPAEQLAAAELAGDFGDLEDGHALLVLARNRDASLARAADLVVSRWCGAPVPVGGFVACRRRLVTEEERARMEEGRVPYGTGWETPESVRKLEEGQVLRDGAWTRASQDERVAAGLVEFQGRWYPPAELERKRRDWEFAWEGDGGQWRFRTNVGPDFAKELGLLLGPAHEEVRRHVGEAPGPGPLALWVFRDFEGYRRFCVSRNLAASLLEDGVVLPGEGLAATYDPGTGDEDRRTAVLGAVAGAFFARTFPKARPPAWYRQAYADYLSASTWESGILTLGVARSPLLAWLRSPLSEGPLPGLEAVVKLDPALAGGASPLLARRRLRAAGWSFYHFLQNSPRSDDHARFRMYEGACRGAAAGAAPLPADWNGFRESFGDAVGEVQTAWRAYVNGL